MSASAHAARRRGRALGRSARVLLPAAVFLLVMALWQAGAWHWLLRLQPYQLPYPLDIYRAALRGSRTLLSFSLYTLAEALGGFALGSGGGLLLAAASVRWRALRRPGLALAAALGAVPIVATAPIFTLWFGFGQSARVAVASVATFATMAISAYKGLTALDVSLLQLMDTYAAAERQVFAAIRWPHALPYVFSALKINTTLALIAALVGEFFGSPRGLGYLIANKVQVADMPVAWSGIAAAAVVGLLFYAAVAVLERAVVPWDVSLRRPE